MAYLEILKVSSVFVLMVVLLRFKVNLGAAMLVATAYLAALYRMALLTAVSVAAASAIAVPTLLLMATLYLIMMMEKVMSDEGLMKRMVSALKILVPDYRPVMAMMPALVGFLPSAGGAVFSAPLVDAVSSQYEVSPVRKSFINYWYRHMCEYTVPLYPGMILAATMLGVPVATIVKSLFPGSLAALLAGIPVAFSGLKRPAATKEAAPQSERKKAVIALAEGTGPILAVVAFSVIFGLHLATSLVVVVGALLLFYRYSVQKAFSVARRAFSPSILLLVIGVMALKDMMEASGAVENLSAYMQGTGVSPLILVFFLPFVAGLLTGYSPACVALSYPLIINLLGTGVDAVRLGAVAYAVGFMGVLVSPVHLCLILTVEYFKADISKVYKAIFLPLLAPVAAIALWNVLVIGRLW